MKKVSIVVLLAIILLTVAAAGATEDFISYKKTPKPTEMFIRGVCRHKAIYCAVVYSEQYPVRIAKGAGNDPESGYAYHVQAQALINNTWCWLSADDLPGMVSISERSQYFFYADKELWYLTLEEFLREEFPQFYGEMAVSSGTLKHIYKDKGDPE